MLLLSGGVHSMPLRYPLAVFIGYVGFLFLLKCWREAALEGAMCPT